MIKRLFFMLSLFMALLASVGATAQGVTREVKKSLRSTLSYGTMKSIAKNSFDIN